MKKDEYIANKMKRTFMMALVLLCALSFLNASSITTEQNTSTASASDNKIMKVKILPEFDILIGFSDKHPNDGTGYLDPFTQGQLKPEASTGMLSGVFYIYHKTNLENYTISIMAEPMVSTKSSKQLLGYDIKIDDKYDVYTDAAGDGALVKGIGDAVNKQYDLFIKEDGATEFSDVMLSDELKTIDNIWFRKIKITVPVIKLLEKSPTGESSWSGKLIAQLNTI